MKSTLLSRFFYLAFFLVLTSFNNASSSDFNSGTVISYAGFSNNKKNTSIAKAEQLFNDLHLLNSGLTQEVFNSAIKGYEKLMDDGVIQNAQYLSIVDLSQSSRKKRFYLIDLKNNKLALNTFVAHGKNSGVDEAERFSNTLNSEKSSLGFYVTKETYSGKHGLSLKLAGLENGFNDNAESRAIVVHGAEYVNEGRVSSSYMGRSQGCPALPESVAPKVIKMIKGGSAVFVYHPDQKYLSRSTILNS